MKGQTALVACSMCGDPCGTPPYNYHDFDVCDTCWDRPERLRLRELRIFYNRGAFIPAAKDVA